MNATIFMRRFLRAGMLAMAAHIGSVFGHGTTQAEAGGYSITQRGPLSRIWLQTTMATNQDGDVTTNSQSYTELATGICYLQNGQYVDSVEQVDSVQDGAQAVQGQHRVHWALNANTPNGAVTVTTPDSKQLSSTVFGLAWFDAASGSNAVVGQLKNCNGAIIAPNQVIYADAFSNVTADICYTYTKAGLSQDIALRQALPAPDRYGLADESSVLQVYTEFINTPEPGVMAVTNQSVVDDQVLDFGVMKMELGHALFRDNQDAPIDAGPVRKQWVHIQNRTFLIESIGYPMISNQLLQLPQASNVRPGRGSVRRLAFAEPRPGRVKTGGPMRLAKAGRSGPQLTVDYNLVSSTNNFTFQGDSTYYISGAVNLSGVATFEGGAVLKYSNFASLNLYAPAQIVCLGTNYSPTVFTAKDDNSVGTPIGSLTNVPLGYYANPAIAFYGTASNASTVVLHHFRISYATEAIYTSGISISMQINDGQIVNCVYGVETPGQTSLLLENVLFANFQTALRLGISGATAENVTFSGGSELVDVEAGYAGYPSANLTNCIVANVPKYSTNAPPMYALLGGAHNGFYNSGGASSNWYGGKTFGTLPVTATSNPFQSVGAGAFYLTNGCPFLQAGTSGLDAGLLAELPNLTTHPPNTNFLGGFMTSNAVLGPVAPRDNASTPDLGWHYAPLDWALNVDVSNATLAVQPGTVLAACGPQFGIWLYTNGVFNSQGTAASPVYVVRYNTVQEQSNTNWESGSLAWDGSLTMPNQADSSRANCAFTKWFVLAGDGQIDNLASPMPLALENCQFFGGAVGIQGMALSATNCLFQRVGFSANDGGGSVPEALFNNLFWNGSLLYTHTGGSPWVFRDNLFNQAAITHPRSLPIDICSNNAYVTTNSGIVMPENHDQILTNEPAYQTGALGNYYYPAILTNLIFQGSELASAAGLYHYTVTTNNAIDGANMVSIGFHYVAVDGNGDPLDSTGDGLPDYVKDSNGNGIFDNGDLANWLDPFIIYDQGSNYLGWTPQHLRLGYWRFNSTNWTNEAGIGPTTSNNLVSAPDWSGNAVSISNNLANLVYPIASNGLSLFNAANGSVRFWFQPDFTSTNGLMTDFGEKFLETVTVNNNVTWSFFLNNVVNTNIGRTIQTWVDLNTQSNAYGRVWTFKDGSANGMVVGFQSNQWYQIAMTYSPSNVALYANGALLATGTWFQSLSNNHSLFELGCGNLFYPPASAITGLSVGNQSAGGTPLLGQLDELETFNYPLTAQQVAAGYPGFGGNPTNTVDTYYLGQSDMLQQYVYGYAQASPTNSVPARLGYWRFDSPSLYAEQGQMPVSVNDVDVEPSWSGTALVIKSDPASQITYPDVGSNGWANINCRQGSLRFWFKANDGGPSSPAPFVYMGSPNGTNEWALELTNSTISFVTRTNQSSPVAILSASIGTLSTTNWMQIVLTYGPTSCALYTNGAPACPPSGGNTNWPSLANRQLGMVIGNSAAHNASINGQFEEMETFNYQLSATDISNNFQMVASVDSDLNGIPDLLEDIHLMTNRPFLGRPVAITGTIEAEQFDMGGPGVGYSHPGTANPSSSYRPSGMFIMNCDDLGGGYCLDRTVSNDWAAYTINVLVAQTYVVETRVAGLGTNGAFKIAFSNSSGVYTNTGAQVITNTGWRNLSSIVSLNSGTNVMTLTMLTNANTNGASFGPNVGRFNYISIYPWWPPPTNGTGSNNLSGQLYTNTDFNHAWSNAIAIQNAVNFVGAVGGGTVSLPAGTYYLAQASPNETNRGSANAAVTILTNNIEIAGSNTTLVAYNRATTLFCLGETFSNGLYSQFSCTNFTLRDLTLEAQPNLAAAITGTNYITNIIGSVVVVITNYTFGTSLLYDTNLLIYNYPDDQNSNLIAGFETGYPVIFFGKDTNLCSVNILITNCQFINGYIQMGFWGGNASNVLVQACQFLWNTNSRFGNVSLLGQFALANFVLRDNVFNGNVNLAPANYAEVSANVGYFASNGLSLTAQGFVFFVQGSNIFLSGNTILNNSLEGINLHGGPNSVVDNVFSNWNSNGSACALAVYGASYNPPDGAIFNATCFIGNSIYGGRTGQEAPDNLVPYICNTSGNTFDLYPPYDNYPPEVGAECRSMGVELNNCTVASICGNTLVHGGYGLYYVSSNASVLVLNNNFGAATNCGIGSLDSGRSVASAQIYGNILGQGTGFHLQTGLADGFGWFLKNNIFLNTNGIATAPFCDPATTPIHLAQ